METLSVLIVDDEPKMRVGIERVVSSLRVSLPDLQQNVRFDTATAESGEEALERLDQKRFDLMLLDLKLPGIDGIEVLRTVVAREQDISVVMITAYASIETAVSATKQGAFDFLPKPFTPQELRSTVEKTVRHVIAQRRARVLERERRQFRFQLISLVSHELKAPIAAIQSYLEAIGYVKEERMREELPHIVDRCGKRLNGMQKMISDLLDLTSIESGQKKRDPRDVDLVEIARECVEQFVKTAQGRGIEIDFSAPETLIYRADPGEMVIVLNNLLSNAIKYNKDGGRVGLVIQRDGDGGVSISVSDTGIGIPKEWIDRLFNEFVRVKSKETKRIDGSGLGLSIVRKIAALYGGEASLESELGEGTTVTVRLGGQESGGEGEKEARE